MGTCKEKIWGVNILGWKKKLTSMTSIELIFHMLEFMIIIIG